MTEFPVIPPDPTPEELARNLNRAALLKEALDLFDTGDDLEQRRRIKRAKRSLESATDTWHDLDDRLAGRPPKKPPQRGRVPKRSQRKRRGK